MTRPATYRPLLLSSGVRASAARAPDKTALICADARRSYADLVARIDRVAAGLLAAGFVRGDRAVVLAPNCIEYPELLCGISDAGGIATTLNPRSSAAEITSACNDCRPRVIFVHADNAGLVQHERITSADRVIVLGDRYEDWLRTAEPQARPLPAIDETEPFTLVYTSGTTGKPKGILISHRSRVLTFHAMAMEYGCYGPEDLQLGIAPMAHGAGFAFIMCSVFFGGTVEILPRFDPEIVVRKLATEPFTGVFMVPTHFHAIFALPEAVLARHRGRPPALRAIMSNAAALPQPTKQKIIAYWGEDLLHETYGSTEAGIVTNLRPPWHLRKEQCVGPAFAITEVRLLDDAGREVADGEIGELYSRSPYIFNGYFGDPEETAAVLRDGWITAGDLAKRDADGFIYIVDRKKDMVVTGGLNVYPREIEEVLQAHDAIHECAVIGIPDEHWGEKLRAFVVPHTGREVRSEDLEAFCRARLAGYKVPREYREVRTLPRNVGGKVLKKALREAG